jgi:hypothetical protein
MGLEEVDQKGLTPYLGVKVLDRHILVPLSLGHDGVPLFASETVNELGILE